MAEYRKGKTAQRAWARFALRANADSLDMDGHRDTWDELLPVPAAVVLLAVSGLVDAEETQGRGACAG